MAKTHVADLEYFEEMHRALDMLLAGYLREHPEKRPSTVTSMELIEWSYQRIEAAKRAGSPEKPAGVRPLSE